MNPQSELKQAVSVLRSGGVIAYPTEYCFGLGCDPQNEAAVQRILSIKQRTVEQGVLMVAADIAQIEYYADLNGLDNQTDILASWPGPTTWLLPKKPLTPPWICGRHTLVALRIPDFSFVRQLCQGFAAPIVSTSANHHGQAECLTAIEVMQTLGQQIDFVVKQPVQGRASASTIRNSLTNQVVR